MPAPIPAASFIANPAAGRTTAVGQARHVAQALSRRGWKTSVHTTGYPGHAAQLARECSRQRAIVVAVGGDGTVSEIATGLLLAPPPVVRLALLPCGTANDIAHQLGIRSSEQTLAALLHGRSRTIDAIEVVRPALSSSNPCFALSFVAAGFAAELIRQTTPFVKRWSGRRLAYTIDESSPR